MNLADLFEQQCQISLSLREGSLGLVCIYCSFHLPLLLFIYLPPLSLSLLPRCVFVERKCGRNFLSRAYNGHIFFVLYNIPQETFVLC